MDKLKAKSSERAFSDWLKTNIKTLRKEKSKERLERLEEERKKNMMEKVKMRNQAECEQAFQQWLNRKRKGERNCKGKLTPKMSLSGRRSNEERGNMQGRWKESPAMTSSRHSRSNSSQRRFSKTRKSGNKEKRGKKGSNSSRNSSRKVLGFESLESEKMSPDLKKMGNYLKGSKYNKNQNNDKYHSKPNKNLKSSNSSRNSQSRKSNEWKQQINSISTSKPPLPHTPNPMKKLSD